MARCATDRRSLVASGRPTRRRGPSQRQHNKRVLGRGHEPPGLDEALNGGDLPRRQRVEQVTLQAGKGLFEPVEKAHDLDRIRKLRSAYRTHVRVLLILRPNFVPMVTRPTS